MTSYTSLENYNFQDYCQKKVCQIGDDSNSIHNLTLINCKIAMHRFHCVISHSTKYKVVYTVLSTK